MTRPAIPTLALSLLLALFLAACGGDDGDRDPTATGGSAATAGATATRSATADPAAAFRAFELPAHLADGLVAGSPDAKVTLEMFEDFQCPHCLSFTLQHEAMLMEEYVIPGKVRLHFRNYPILGPESGNAALAAVCAAAQDKFWPYHKELFLLQADQGQLRDEKLNVGRFDRVGLNVLATHAGLDTAAFDTCLVADATLQAVSADIRAATSAGLRGTPAFILDGRPIPAPATAADWRRVLDAAAAGN